MRITGGELRGRVFHPPDRPNFRPSMEKLRLAVFSMLDSMGGIEGMRVLDLYAGSGAFGFEALARGAKSCDFIEADRALGRFIQDTAGQFGLSRSISVVSAAIPKALERVEGLYNLVFSDPPYSEYDSGLGEQLIARNLLAEGALLIAEAPAVSSGLTGLLLELVRDKRHGDSRVRIYRAAASPAA